MHLHIPLRMVFQSITLFAAAAVALVSVASTTVRKILSHPLLRLPETVANVLP